MAAALQRRQPEEEEEEDQHQHPPRQQHGADEGADAREGEELKLAEPRNRTMQALDEVRLDPEQARQLREMQVMFVPPSLFSDFGQVVSACVNNGFVRTLQGGFFCSICRWWDSRVVSVAHLWRDGQVISGAYPDLFFLWF